MRARPASAATRRRIRVHRPAHSTDGAAVGRAGPGAGPTAGGGIGTSPGDSPSAGATSRPERGTGPAPGLAVIPVANDPLPHDPIAPSLLKRRRAVNRLTLPVPPRARLSLPPVHA